MPIDIEHLDGGIGYYITVAGSLSGEEFIEWIRDHFARDQSMFRENRYSITDLSRVTETDVHGEEIRRLKSLGEHAASHVNPDRVVAIIATTDLMFGLARILDAIADQVPWEIAVFRSRSESEEWVRERVNARFGIRDLTFKPSIESSTTPGKVKP